MPLVKCVAFLLNFSLYLQFKIIFSVPLKFTSAENHHKYYNNLTTELHHIRVSLKISKTFFTMVSGSAIAPTPLSLHIYTFSIGGISMYPHDFNALI